ncbi:MAG: AMP-binding protein [Ilumatobacteraceae bacterium]
MSTSAAPVGLVEILDAIAAATDPSAPCVIGPGERHLDWGEFTERRRRLAGFLHSRGLGCNRARHELGDHESGQDHLGLLLHNCPEYLEAMIGAFGARVAPLNVNYRYTATELVEVLGEAGVTAVIVHDALSAVLADALPELPGIRTVLQVADGSGAPLLPGAVRYEEALSAAPALPADVAPSPDDAYLLATGGTTGRPRAVMWRNGDAVIGCFDAAREAQPVEAFVERARPGLRSLPTAPFMHGAGHWTALRALLAGGTVVIPDDPERFDPAAIWSAVERHGVTLMLIVGESFARPLLAEFDPARHDASSLNVILSGGAPLSAATKERLLERLPTVMIVDGFGASESGGQMSIVSTAGSATSGVFRPRSAATVVLAPDRTRVLSPGDPTIGWLASTGRLPLGYLGDPERTRATFPTVDGVRYAVPGDHARLLADGSIEAFGRESVCINTGGEKVYAEEVEDAVLAHPAVRDCIVVGRVSDRWGSEVVAVVSLEAGCDAPGVAELSALLAGRLARYKHPKSVIVVDEVRRSPAGKADYAWARSVSAEPA